MAAKKKKKLPTPAPAKPVTYTPPDYLRGSKTVGKKYTAYNTYGQGRPDFGKDLGPGEPYHEVQKTVQKPIPQSRLPKWGTINSLHDARLSAIRRRLQGM